MSSFLPVTEEQIRGLIARSKPTTSDSDPVPTGLLLECTDVIVFVTWRIVNPSLETGVVLNELKQDTFKPLLKKHNLNPEIDSVLLQTGV